MKIITLDRLKDFLNNCKNKFISSVTTSDSATTASVSNGVLTIPKKLEEAFITWGGKDFSGSYGCLDAAMIPTLGANRFAGIKSGVTFEYSRDGGKTWQAQADDYKLFLPDYGGSLKIGNNSGSEVANSQWQSRITINTTTAKVYTAINKFALYLSTNGATGFTVDIEKQNEAKGTWEVVKTAVPLEGYSGWNIINVKEFTTKGNTTSQYYLVRFTFKFTGVSSTHNKGPIVNKIQAFGGVGWNTPSDTALLGYPYKENETTINFNKALSSSNSITGSSIKKTGGTSSQILMADGSTQTWTNVVTSATMSSTATSPSISNHILTIPTVAGPKGDTGAQGLKGDKGDTGAAATITIGTVTTGAAGTSASVINVGTSSAAKLNFVIPQGVKGEKGDTGLLGPKGDLGLKGDTGLQGPKGDKGDKGDIGDSGHIYNATVDSLAEGVDETSSTLNIASGIRSHAEGSGTVASGNQSHAEGNGSIASGNYSHAEGYSSIASNASHSEGSYTVSSGRSSHSEGDYTELLIIVKESSTKFLINDPGFIIRTGMYVRYGDSYSKIIAATGNSGRITISLLNELPIVVGLNVILITVADNIGSHVEGTSSSSVGSSAHAEGAYSCAAGNRSHAEGYNTYAYANLSHAEGYKSKASGDNSHAEGSSTTASASQSHAEGNNTTASGSASHAEGSGTVASGYASHAEGYLCKATGDYSRATGVSTTASHLFSNVNGRSTKSSNNYQTVIGRANADKGDALFIIGNGTVNDNNTINTASNAFVVTSSGNGVFSGSCTASAFPTSSDSRLKDVISDLDISKAYNLIENCSTILYTLKSEAGLENKRVQLGLLAQEVKEFFPEIVYEDADGFLSLDYSRLTVIILSALKDLVIRVSNLEKK